MEDYREGERIREYKIEGFSEGKWVEVTKGISVGRKKIDFFKDIEVEQIKLTVNKAAAEPIIRSFSAYYVSNFKPPVKKSMRVYARPEIVSSWKRSDLKNNRMELKLQLDDKIRVPGQYALSLIPDVDQIIEVKSASMFYNGNKAMKEFVTIKGNTILINQTAHITDDSELSIVLNLHLNEICDGKIEFVPRLIH